MLNRRTMLLIFLCTLFVLASAFGQEESDSHIIRVIKEIDVAELDEKVDNLDQSRQNLTQTLKNLDNSISSLNTNVEYLNVTVARLDERTTGIVDWLHAIFGMVGAILASILSVFVTLAITYLRKKDDNSNATSTQATQESQNEVTSTQSTQVSQSEETTTQGAQASQSDIVPDNVLQVDFLERKNPDPSLRRNSPHGKH